jgi:CheY-like chemotaxis protein
LTIEAGAVELDQDHASLRLGGIEGRQVLIAVSDTGTGMDAQTRSRIFEPFYTTKPVGEGTGLGLAMAFGAIERVGGRIWVYSEPEHGTSFQIYLPLAAGGVVTEPDESRIEIEMVGGEESILLLEDDVLVRELLVVVLTGLGYNVTAAARPAEAIALSRDRRFDLLVSDVVMPEMMGDAVAARLRMTQPDLPVVFMSGYTARALGFNLSPLDVLVRKPLAPRDVARTVRAALDRSLHPSGGSRG